MGEHNSTDKQPTDKELEEIENSAGPDNLSLNDIEIAGALARLNAATTERQRRLAFEQLSNLANFIEEPKHSNPNNN